jgi:hypothetical protein
MQDETMQDEPQGMTKRSPAKELGKGWRFFPTYADV